jgi:hypothetical protein
MSEEDWIVFKRVKNLVNELFNEYAQASREKFPEPKYAFWLESCINHAKNHFFHELRSDLEDMLPPPS